VPYRLLEGAVRFKKWEWITARLTLPNQDHRPESRHIDIDSIERSRNIIETRRGDWIQRLRWIQPHIVEGFEALKARRQTTGETLGFLRVSRIIELKITPATEPDWTESDKIKLTQDGLFDSEEIKRRPPLRKLPYDFHYRYECVTPMSIEPNTHKLTDWEIGAFFWNCMKNYGQKGWEAKFRQRLENDFSSKDLLFLMGTIHRFPDQWLIVGIVYPPTPSPDDARQLGLPLDQ
jgi:hypothetical protein